MGADELGILGLPGDVAVVTFGHVDDHRTLLLVILMVSL